MPAALLGGTAQGINLAVDGLLLLLLVRGNASVGRHQLQGTLRRPHGRSALGRPRFAVCNATIATDCCAPRLAETPFSGRDPQEGDDNDDRGNRTDWDRSGPGWAHVAQTQARCRGAPAAG